jgi:acyl carrier protein
VNRASASGENPPLATVRDLQQVAARVLGTPIVAEHIREDVDLYSAADELVDGIVLDSIAIVEVIAAIEDAFGVPLAPDGDDELTLTSAAERIRTAQLMERDR